MKMCGFFHAKYWCLCFFCAGFIGAFEVLAVENSDNNEKSSINDEADKIREFAKNPQNSDLMKSICSHYNKESQQKKADAKAKEIKSVMDFRPDQQKNRERVPGLFRIIDNVNNEPKFIAGVEQPGKGQFENIIKTAKGILKGKMSAEEGGKRKERFDPEKIKFFVVDLREEPHLFLKDDNNTIAPGDRRAFVGKTSKKAMENEQIFLKSLLGNKDQSIFQIPKKDKDPVDVGVKEIYAGVEQDLVEKANATYKRIPITDRDIPTPEVVDQIVALYKEIADNPSYFVFFHCKGGQGRTQTVMLMFDALMYHEKGVNDKLRMIMKRHLEQSKDPEGNDLKGIEQYKKVPKDADAEDRKEIENKVDFLNSFEAYLNDHDRGYDTGASYSNWESEFVKSK